MAPDPSNEMQPAKSALPRVREGQTPRLESGEARQLRPVVPLEIQSLLGAPPVSREEDALRYDDLLAQVSSVVKPKDVLEWLWVKDVVDLVWEAQRLRRIKIGLISISRQAALAEVLKPLLSISKFELLLDDIGKRLQVSENIIDAEES